MSFKLMYSVVRNINYFLEFSSVLFKQIENIINLNSFNIIECLAGIELRQNNFKK